VGRVLYSSCHLLIEDIRITFVTSKADKNRSGILEKKYQLNLICKQKESAFSSLLKRSPQKFISGPHDESFRSDERSAVRAQILECLRMNET